MEARALAALATIRRDKTLAEDPGHALTATFATANSIRTARTPASMSIICAISANSLLLPHQQHHTL